MQRYLERPLTQVRRKDRVLVDEEWIDCFLAMSAVGHLAVIHEGQPLLHSNFFWFDGTRVYWHTAQVGKLRAVLEAGVARACFTVTEFGRVLPAGTPFDFSTEYASVVCYGTVRVVADAAEKKYALEGVMGKYAPHLVAGVDYAPMPDERHRDHERLLPGDRDARRQAQCQAGRIPGLSLSARLIHRRRAGGGPRHDAREGTRMTSAED